MNISSFIVKARRRMGLSQKGLADALGVSQGSVSKWEAGKESPRAETVERIREMSGITVTEPDPEAPLSPEADFSTFCEVMFVGSFTDGMLYEPFNANEFKSLFIYLKKSVASQRLEAWHVSGMYEALPNSFIGIFKILDEDEAVQLRGHPARNSKILTRNTSEDGAVSLSIEELYGNERRGYWLWPLDRRTRTKTLPAQFKLGEVSADGASTAPYAQLVAVLYEPSGHYQLRS